jgi:hypothetical protein
MLVEGKWLNEEHLLVHGKCNRAASGTHRDDQKQSSNTFHISKPLHVATM